MLSPPAQTSVKRTSAGSPDSPRSTLTSWTRVDRRFPAKTRRSSGVKSPIASRISRSWSARTRSREGAGHVGNPPHVVMTDLVGLGGVEHRDLDRLQVAHRPNQRLDVAVGGIVPLHVGDHADGARGPVRGQDVVRLARREAQGLLGQHVLAGPQRIDDHLAVRVRARHQHGVERLPQKIPVVGEPPGARRSGRRRIAACPGRRRRAPRARSARGARGGAGGASPGRSARSPRRRSGSEPCSPLA